MKHGFPEGTLRKADWGKRHIHPMWHTWKWMTRAKGGREPIWDDFWAFVNSVGERPSKRHRLLRYDKTKPFGPDNCYWKTPVSDIVLDAEGIKKRAKYGRDYHKAHPHRMKNQYLKRRFGIGLAEYDQMLSAQNCKCAICGGTDPYYALSVDHCHETNAIRGLLCGNCNRALGFLQDSEAILEAALHYLRNSRKLKAA